MRTFRFLVYCFECKTLRYTNLILYQVFLLGKKRNIFLIVLTRSITRLYFCGPTRNAINFQGNLLISFEARFVKYYYEIQAGISVSFIRDKGTNRVEQHTDCYLLRYLLRVCTLMSLIRVYIPIDRLTIYKWNNIRHICKTNQMVAIRQWFQQSVYVSVWFRRFCLSQTCHKRTLLSFWYLTNLFFIDHIPLIP